MIKEQDLLEAIAECQGDKNPNANTCIKLAAYYTIYENMYGKTDIKVENSPQNVKNAGYMYENHSFAPSQTVRIESGTEFAEVVNGMEIDRFLQTMDELMETLQILAPKLYDATLRKLT